MAKTYKSGSWAQSGRVMPGQRTKETHTDQLLANGSVVTTNKDQLFSPKEVKALLTSIFPEAKEKNGRIYVYAENEKGKSVAFYTRNIYHLGGNWSAEKKRIAIVKDFLEFYESNKRHNTETILLGLYHYYPDGQNGVELFVCFSATTYAQRNANGSAAHIHIVDLQNALKYGIYRRLDKSGNELLVLNKENFAKHINELRKGNELPAITSDKQLLEYFGQIYVSLPKTLYGIQCYEEMFADNDNNRKQGAWEGWYIEYYVKKYLAQHPVDAISWWSSKRKGDLDFDLKFLTEEHFYGDVKSDDAHKSVQGNKKNSVDILVKEHGGRLWYVVFEFAPEKDSNHGYETTIWWNKKLGKDNTLSYSTRMKHSITLQHLNVYEINQFAFKYLKEYAVSPADGKPREL